MKNFTQRIANFAATAWGKSLILYLLFVGAYAGSSGLRLRGPSSETHFSHLASMWMAGRLDLGRVPPNQNDWAEVEYLTLKDGRTLAGAFIRSQPGKFHTLEGKVESVTDSDIASRFKKYYVSFPPFPAILFLPFVAIWGLRFNDVLFTVLLAPLGPILLFWTLERLRQRGDSARSTIDNLWLTLFFGVGTVYFYASVLGQVWYTAHIVAMILCGLFVYASLDLRHPMLAGVALGALVLTRPQMGFWGIFFLGELDRKYSFINKKWLRPLVQVGIPVALFGIVGAWFNWARFHSVSEFGHYYLNVRWTDRIQRYGLFNYAFLSRNLAAAFTLTPKLIAKRPFIQIPWHGLSVLITSPALIYLLWPKRTGGLHRVLWLTAIPIALLGFLYQNDGWVQFGYRFILDFLFALVMLLAVGGRPISWQWKLLIVIGIGVNLFGAITFGRAWQFYADTFFPIGTGEL